jgi:hypothetical protein
LEVGDRIFWKNDKGLIRMGNMLVLGGSFVLQNLASGLPPRQQKLRLGKGQALVFASSPTRGEAKPCAFAA